jgi:hypothetical protein
MSHLSVQTKLETFSLNLHYYVQKQVQLLSLLSERREEEKILDPTGTRTPTPQLSSPVPVAIPTPHLFSSVEVNSAWNNTSTPTYSMAWCLLKNGATLPYMKQQENRSVVCFNAYVFRQETKWRSVLKGCQLPQLSTPHNTGMLSRLLVCTTRAANMLEKLPR